MRNSTMRLTEKRYLHHCSFRSEKNQRIWDKLITLMKKVCCQLSPFSHTQVRGDPYANLVRPNNENQVAKWKTKESGFSFKDKEQILAEVRTEIQKHQLQAHSHRRCIQELNAIIDSQRREIDHTIASDEQSRRDQLLLQEQLSEQNRDLREAHIKSFHEMEDLKRVQELRIDEFSRRRLIENQDTILELTARIQELQNEVNCMNDSRDFKDATQWTIPRSQSTYVIPTSSRSWRNAMPFSGNAEPQRWAAKYLGYAWFFLETFLWIHRRLLHHLI